jgi:V/A-type H+-transporting ATPase subunit E
MEEMVTTEALEREILDDARKKGEKLLKDGDAEAERLRADYAERTRKALESIAADYAARAERYRAENLARLPLEKGRMKASYVDRLLRNAAREYFGALPEERITVLLADHLAPAAALVGKAELAVRYAGISEKAARAVFARALPEARPAAFTPDADAGSAGVEASTKDRVLSVRATLELVGELLLDEKRGELAQALCAEALAL